MPSLRIVCASILFALSACACAPQPAPRSSASGAAPRTPAASVLLISIDAFRADYLERGLTPNLTRLAQEGVRAKWMTPSYPSLTFPNLYTIVTGLRPDRHGIVHNTMRDATLGAFTLSNRDAVGNGAWWGGEPVWVSAEKAGLPTGIHFWPGSEAEIMGVRPTRWKVFDATLPANGRVDTVLAWLTEDVATRPRFATLYLDDLDVAGHSHGPASAEMTSALAHVDAAIGRLVSGLTSRGLLDDVNLILTSDHGMAPVPQGNVVAIEDMVDARDAAMVTTGQSVGFNPLPGRERAAEARLVGKHDRYDCWRKSELPERWHYGRNPRVPAIVCQMHEGWDAGTRAAIAKRAPGPRGSHGFDPALPSMRALFLARGPSFRRGEVVPAIDNIDVYPMLMSLLGLHAAPNDGNPRALDRALSRR